MESSKYILANHNVVGVKLINILKERKEVRNEQKKMENYLSGLDRININTKYIIKHSAEGLKQVLKQKLTQMKNLTSGKVQFSSAGQVFRRVFQRFKDMILHLDQIHNETVFAKTPFWRPGSYNFFKLARDKQNEEALRLLLSNKDLMYEYNSVLIDNIDGTEHIPHMCKEKQHRTVKYDITV